MTSLGKRKERSDSVVHGSTLFVSNLPYTATSTDLQTLFSDIAPVRSAFVVLEPGSGVSKGVGYVSFSIKEDAEEAFQKVGGEGVVLNGRKLRVQWAENKPKDKGDKSISHKDPKPRPLPKRNSQPHDPLAVRIIVISGLPPSIDAKTLWKKVRKYNGAEKVEWPVEDDVNTAHVLFSTPATAQEAVNKLHAHVFKSSLLSVTLKKRLDNLSAFEPSANQKSSKVPAPSRANRLIVRNIPFDITEQDLRAVFLPFGPIHSIHIPSEDGRAKGFAFVWMLSKKDAQKAMDGCNGINVSAGMAEGLVGDKQKRKKVRREEAKGRKGQPEEEGVDLGTERTIAVDWALSKEKWEKEKGKLEDDIETDEKVSEDESNDEDKSSNEEDEEEELGVHQSDSDSEDSHHQASDDGDEEIPVKPQLPPPQSGTTLFIRNVPFAVTDDELRVLFRSFGPLRYARITMDPETGRSRGTGFACFWNKEDADKVIEQSELLRVETTGGDAQPVKNPFTLPSILTPDPSSSLAQSLVLHGRTLDVVRAVTRDEAGKLKEEGEKKREKADKRNLYLLREGVILPNTPAASTLPSIELEKRTNSFNSRRALLRSNPSLYVSRTRLSVRQIPLWVTERGLKRLAIHATKAFEKEVKEGKRAPLTPDELIEVHVEEDVQEEDKEDGKGKGKKKFLGRSTAVKQTKIIRQSERVDAITGKGRSRGYGFVEMQKHANALRVLRWANNNDEVGELVETWWVEELGDLVKVEKEKPEKERDEARIKRMADELTRGGRTKGEKKGNLIVEFSIENVQVVKRRSERVLTDVIKPKAREKLSMKARTKAGDDRPLKKRRISEDSMVKSTGGDVKIAKSGSSIGALIGRKRKERKSKKS